MRISDWSSDVCSSDLPDATIVSDVNGAVTLSNAAAAKLFDELSASPDDRLSLPHILKPRSEEHTSELQSLMRISYAVFCLKKKKKKNTEKKKKNHRSHTQRQNTRRQKHEHQTRKIDTSTNNKYSNSN